MFSLTLKYDNDSIEYKVCMKMGNRYHFLNVNRKISVVLTSWISSITIKISWIVGWPWSNHVCVCVWVCVLCLSVYNLIHGPQKQTMGFFLSGNLDFGLEKSWKNHGTFFWDFCGNPEEGMSRATLTLTYIIKGIQQCICNKTAIITSCHVRCTACTVQGPPLLTLKAF